MIISESIINNSHLDGQIAHLTVLKAKGETGPKSLSADLLLTALIDAFSILVIFLLMNFSSTGEILFITKGMELPKAKRADLLDVSPVIKVFDGRIFLQEKEIKEANLTEKLLDFRKAFLKANPTQEFPGVITIQADRRTKFESLNGVVLASNQAGFSDLKFAVVSR
jgi:biopolymer transport protein ExbD